MSEEDQKLVRYDLERLGNYVCVFVSTGVSLVATSHYHLMTTRVDSTRTLEKQPFGDPTAPRQEQ
jgi:hypothetical protein